VGEKFPRGKIGRWIGWGDQFSGFHSPQRPVGEHSSWETRDS